MISYLCLSLRYANQSSGVNELRKIAKAASVKTEVEIDSIKYVLTDGSALVDNGSSVEAIENEWWKK